VNERQIVPLPQEQTAIDDVKRLANIVLALRNDVFKDGVDFGKIPGTGDKPTLLLPGMEKLIRALRLRPEYIERSKVEDFENARIYYRYECRLIEYETGYCVATAIGSANSYESKWRWREQKRVCPKCGKETINRSKFAPKGAPQGTEPGWYCYSKAGGCGAEFSAKDPAIVEQTVGRIENPDIFDQMNTIDKIAQKRALSSAIKGAANVSEFFTVDLEDFQRYDTTPVMVSHDDGRKVDVETGEVVEPPAPEIKIAEKPAQSLTPVSQLEQPASEPDPLQWVDEMRESGEVKAEALPQTDDQAVMLAVNHKYASHRKHYENTVAMLMREGTLDKDATPAQKYMAVKARAEAKQTQKESA
jgi:ribosomal protein S26